VWALGSETNVGKYMSRPDDHTGQEPPAPAAPRYEPATAQVPPSAHPTAPDPEPDTAEFAPAYAMASAPATGSGAAGFAPGAVTSAQPHLAPTRVTALGTAPAGAPSAVQGTAVQGTAAVAAPPAGNGKLSLYQRLSNSPEAEAGRAKAPARQPESAASYPQDIPSADDETIEESGVFGRAAVERILGGKLIEERSLDGSPLLPRY
jgi:DNA polymerase-3 subunit gamma/tau